MKKFYTLIALAFAAMSASADVVLTVHGSTIDPSETIEIIAEETNYGDETDPYIMIECGADEPKVTNTGSSAANFSVTVDTQDWKHFTWCGISTQCQPMTSSSETRSGVVDAGKSLNLVLDAVFGGYDDDYNPIWGTKYYGTYTATITITEGSKKTAYTINYVYDQRSSCGVYPEGDGPNAITTLTGNTSTTPAYDLLGRSASQRSTGNLYIQGGRKFIQK